MEDLLTKEEFIKTYLDDMKEFEIIEKLGKYADEVEYEELSELIKESFSNTIDEYVEDDGLIHNVSFRYFNQDVISDIKEKIEQINNERLRD